MIDEDSRQSKAGFHWTCASKQ